MPCIAIFVLLIECLCYLQIAGQIFDMCIINCYAPTKDKDEKEKSIFNEDLERILDSLPNNCIKLITEDLNAQEGKEQFFRLTISQGIWHSLSNNNEITLFGFEEFKGRTSLKATLSSLEKTSINICGLFWTVRQKAKLTT